MTETTPAILIVFLLFICPKENIFEGYFNEFKSKVLNFAYLKYFSKYKKKAIIRFVCL